MSLRRRESGPHIWISMMHAATRTYLAAGEDNAIAGLWGEGAAHPIVQVRSGFWGNNTPHSITSSEGDLLARSARCSLLDQFERNFCRVIQVDFK